MGRVALLVSHELRLLLKDRQALGLLFVMPLVFIVFLTLALQDVYLAKVGKKIQVEFVGGPRCMIAGSICDSLLNELKRMQYDIRLLEAPDYQAPLTLLMPADIDATVESMKAGKTLRPEERMKMVFDPTLDQSVRALMQSNLLLAMQSVMLVEAKKKIEAAQKEGAKIGGVTDVIHFAGLVEERSSNGMVLPNPIQQTVPAWALFGMFFIVIPMANSMIRDRKLGVFKRLISFPVLRSQLIAGKILPFLILNILQFALMFAVGIFVLPKITQLSLVLDFQYWQILAVTAACAFAATAYGLMVSCLTKTAEQASAFGALSVVILAIMGGVMIPRFVMPEFMQKISLLSPLYWGLEAYLDVIVRKSQFVVALHKILVLLGFGTVCLIAARLRFRWSDGE